VFERVIGPVATATYLRRRGEQTSMHRVRFDPTIPVFEQAKTFGTLDCAATMFAIYATLQINVVVSFMNGIVEGMTASVV
jgi:hypothetical protein